MAGAVASVVLPTAAAAAAVGGVCPPVPGRTVVAVIVDFGSAQPGGPQALCVPVGADTDAGTDGHVIVDSVQWLPVKR